MTGLGSAKRQSRPRTGAGRTRGETRLSFDIRRLYIRLGILRINPAVFLLAASALTLGYFYMFSLAYLFAFLHELGHIAAAKKLGVRIVSIEIQPFGVCGRLGSEFIKDPFNEILIALAGPAVNISVCLIMLIAGSTLRGAADFIGVYRDYILSVNICLALINLLPALPLDGGRVVKAALALKCGAVRAYNAMIRFSRTIVALLLLAAALLLVTSGYNFSMILISVFMLGNLANEQRNISLIQLKEILYHKEKLPRGKLSDCVPVAAYGSTPARVLLKKLSYNKYYIINVLDDGGEIVKTLTESQVVDALINRSVRIKLSEI